MQHEHYMQFTKSVMITLLQQQQTIQLPDPNSEYQTFIVNIRFASYDCVDFVGTSAMVLIIHVIKLAVKRHKKMLSRTCQ